MADRPHLKLIKGTATKRTPWLVPPPIWPVKPAKEKKK